jgi:hypothetical protein
VKANATGGVGMWEIDAEAQKEIDQSTDRAAAICGGSYLEGLLLDALKRHLVKDEAAFKKMFENSGPLATFEARIRIAYLTSLMTVELSRDLLILKDVRNKFAHRLDIQSFEVPTVRDMLGNLAYLTTGIMMLETIQRRPATARERYLTAIGDAAMLLRTRRLRQLPEPLGQPYEPASASKAPGRRNLP